MNSTKLFTVFFMVYVFGMTAFGADRALIVGIEHYADEKKCNKEMNNLEAGCVTPTFGGVADAMAMEKFIQAKFGFSKGSIKILKESEATADGIRAGFLDWLIRDTKPGDRVFFFYSGHGTRIEDDDENEEADKRDELLAPFDVQTVPQLANFIRDDEINGWIAALLDRQVVMVFDSCHSGTISRSIQRKGERFSKYLITEKVPTTRGGFTDLFSDVPKNRALLDLSTVTDKYMQGKTPNLVVISAAQADQQAIWFDVNGSLCDDKPPNANYRGALAYLFEKIYSAKNPTLAQLDTELKREMKDLGEKNRLCRAETGYQIPEVEYSPSMANQTLWRMTSAVNSAPVWTQSPMAILRNPLSNIKVILNFTNQTNSYRIGECIEYSVKVEEPVYLYVVVFSEIDTDVATVIYPYYENERNQDRNNFKKAGTYNLSAVAQDPLGKDLWVVIAAKQRISNLENLRFNQPFSWQEIYAKIGILEIQNAVREIARTRGVGNATEKLKNSDWQTSFAVMTTLPKSRDDCLKFPEKCCPNGESQKK